MSTQGLKIISVVVDADTNKYDVGAIPVICRVVLASQATRHDGNRSSGIGRNVNADHRRVSSDEMKPGF
jgi:hypothetical protein